MDTFAILIQRANKENEAHAGIVAAIDQGEPVPSGMWKRKAYCQQQVLDALNRWGADLPRRELH